VDGRFVAFSSVASNLVSDDTNGTWDVFVHDRQTGQTSRVSVSSGGQEGNDLSWWPSISANGRFIAFSSEATNLVPGDTNGYWDIFVHDRQTGQTSRVSVSSAGQEATNYSSRPAISADGRFVAFESFSGNLVPGDTNGGRDVFVHDRQTGQTSRVSVSSTGEQGNYSSNAPSMSADGRFVAFESLSGNLVPFDTNGARDVFVHDRYYGQTSRVSMSSTGQEGNGGSWWPSISADGRFVAFGSEGSNLVAGDGNGWEDVFVHDRQTGQTSRVSVSSTGQQGTNFSSSPSISAGGRFVAFHSPAAGLVPGDTNNYWDVFVHDRQMSQTSRVSVSSSGQQGHANSSGPSISADGRFVAYESGASTFVLGDTNGAGDIFLHQYQPDSRSLSGQVVLGGLTPGSITPSVCLFEFRQPGTTQSVWSALALLDAEGYFTMSGPAPDGLYDLAVKHPRWLRKVVQVDTSQGNVTDVLIHLAGGDIDGDNEVSIGDYALLSAAFGSSPGDPSWNELADLDGDGEVSIGDYALLSQNFGLIGDE